ncbi:MAG: acetyl-CoA C-acyltransferase [Candidatus Kapabacteria bacterium]|nr:acetyl-CoA C-acyltransferase [Candidatus Kapabacteria bacterium]
MKPVYILEPLRTPVGRYGGALSAVRPDDMAGDLIAALVDRVSLDPSSIDDVIIGCANQAGEDNRNIARMAVLLSGLPKTVPGVTVNRLCASSLEAVIQGMRGIASGENHLVIAGGVESMSRAPYSLPKNVSGGAMFGNITAYDTALGWRYPNVRLEKIIPLETMGETAENIAERWGITREDQDQFALRSHARACQARDAGIHAEEIVPVRIPQKKGEAIIVEHDEQPRRDTSLERLATLGAAFRKGGTVTAGNSSTLNDGAGMMILASEEALERQPQLRAYVYGRVMASGAVGVDPRIMGIGPVGAIQQACSRAGISVEDLGLIEINEAFAAQAIACIRNLGLDADSVNVNGGAIAIGHPLGMSGARILGSLVRQMRRGEVRFGAAALCIGVGQGLAVVVESVRMQ